MCLGDSITEQGSFPDGWVALLQNAFIRKADVVNRGYSGYNSNMALWALRQTIIQGAYGPPPDLVVITLGSNDSAVNTAATRIELTAQELYSTGPMYEVALDAELQQPAHVRGTHTTFSAPGMRAIQHISMKAPCARRLICDCAI